ncbi:MAG: hypothetical protein JO323_04525 [Acidobacteriia bacterium]|nr:hypothetical protein [Terriglobia bacterium]
MKYTFWRSLIAVVVGNAVYFTLDRFLPPAAQHQPFQLDWGLAVDAWICLVCYGLIRLIQ